MTFPCYLCRGTASADCGGTSPRTTWCDSCFSLVLREPDPSKAVPLYRLMVTDVHVCRFLQNAPTWERVSWALDTSPDEPSGPDGRHPCAICTDFSRLIEGVGKKRRPMSQPPSWWRPCDRCIHEYQIQMWADCGGAFAPNEPVPAEISRAREQRRRDLQHATLPTAWAVLLSDEGIRQ
jgi:hypothetical protein